MDKGINLYKQGKFHEALRYFKSIDLNKKGMDAHTKGEVSYYLGLCYTKLEQYDEALAYLENVAEISEDFTQIYQSHMVIGYLYASTGRYRLAEFEFQHLLEAGYESSKVHAALGYLFFKQGNIPASIKSLEEALALDSKNSTALNSLAFIMAHEEIRLPLALKYIREALLIRPRSPAYLDTLGWVLFKNGEKEKAYKVLRKARELAPTMVEIREHCAEVRKTIGNEKIP